ncbi:MAG: DUF1064 domain-containing protein [Oscillospiraceae bacterium]|nr:DUF1064 domain-containing protein [Oscillospiraceae bacterium]
MRWSAEEYNEYLNRIRGATAKPKPKNKYNAKKIWVDGICFDSLKEADYYCNLKLLQRAGAIKGFCRQARFVITEGTDNSNRAAEYVADFVIFDKDDTVRIVDTKGVETKVFKLKMKMFREKYPDLAVLIE